MKEILLANRKELDKKKVTVITYKKTQKKDLRLYTFFPTGKPTSCVVCIHGGGWRSETPLRLVPHAAYFAELGAIGISVEYRLMEDDLDIRDGLEDCIDALTYIRTNLLKEYGKMPIVALGDSAGAYYAVCLGNQTILNRFKAAPEVVDFVVDLNGIVDLTGKWSYGIVPKGQEILNDLAKEYSPLFQVQKGDAPAYIIHGEKDKTVALEDSIRYHETLQKQGINSSLVVLPDKSHAFILFDYKYDDRFIEGVLFDIASRLKKLGFI